MPCQCAHLGCRSDGVIASLKTGKQFTKVVNRRPQRRCVLQDSQDIPPGLNNPAEIQSLDQANIYVRGESDPSGFIFKKGQF